MEGMVSGASVAAKGYADLDESGGVNINDMGYVTGNFGKYDVTIAYTAFLSA